MTSVTSVAARPTPLPGAATMPGGGVRYDLDVFRGIGSIFVVVFHAYQHNRAPGTWAWPLQGTVFHYFMMDTDGFVSMFFVISGFLLALPYVKSILDDSRSPLPARSFLIRRLARILPIYYAVVITMWGLSNPVFPGDWQDLLEHVTFTHVFDSTRIFYTDGPAWSLGDEVQFYLLLAVLGTLGQHWLRRLASRTARIGWMLAAIGALIAISLGYKAMELLVWHASVTDYAVWFGPVARLDLFAAGLALAVATGSGLLLHRRVHRIGVAALGCAVILWGYTHRPLPDTPDPFTQPVVALGCALAFAAIVMSSAPAPRWLRWRPLVLVGLFSYSMYLWHEPMLRMLDSLHVLPDLGTFPGFLASAALLLPLGLFAGWVADRVIVQTGLKVVAAFDRGGRSRDYYPELAD